MNTHAEQELLSAFVDGELNEREQVTLEAHLASCADCRAVLGALRATLGDLASLPEALPGERDSWALRSAIAKERRLDRRGRRWYLISGGAAAALVAILAFALSTAGNGGIGVRLGPDGAATSRLALRFNSANYTDSSARQVLLNFSSASTENDVLDQSSGGTGGGSWSLDGAQSPPAAQAEAYSAGSGKSRGTDDDAAGLSRCVDTVIGSTDQDLTPRYFEAARYEGNDVFLLVFEVTQTKKLELWVVARDTCETKFFAQTRA